MLKWTYSRTLLDRIPNEVIRNFTRSGTNHRKSKRMMIEMVLACQRKIPSSLIRMVDSIMFDGK